MIVGSNPGKRAEVYISNGAVAEIALMEIGGGSKGSGLVSVESVPGRPRSKLQVNGDLQLGSDAGGEGILSLVNSDLEVGGNLTIGPNGRLIGIGAVQVAGEIVNGSDIVPGPIADLVPDNSPARGQGQGKRGTSDPPGLLNLIGKFVQTPEGSIVTQVSGPAAGTEHGQLVIHGDAAIDGKLVLHFINGYAPKAGDTFDVVNTTGTTEGSFASVEVKGLKEGAQFSSAQNGGTLSMEAVNDTESLPVVSTKGVGKRKAAEKGRKPTVFLISRTGDKSAPLSVAYEVNGRAENGIDYAFLSGTATIPKGKSAVAVPVKPIDDGQDVHEFRARDGTWRVTRCGLRNLDGEHRGRDWAAAFSVEGFGCESTRFGCYATGIKSPTGLLCSPTGTLGFLDGRHSSCIRTEHSSIGRHRS